MAIFETKFVQALLEFTYPKVSAAIQWKLFYPYIAFLMTFMYYTLFHFEWA